MRGLSWGMLALFASGCAGNVDAVVTITPPPPGPAAASAEAEAPACPPGSDCAPVTDEDGDEVADDRCPTEPETVNGYKDDDGCPDVLPPFYVAKDTIHYDGELRFGLLGGLQNGSEATIAGIAKLLAEKPEITLVEVGAHIVDTSGDGDEKSRRRARSVKKALVKAGVPESRLQDVGFGKRCPDGGTRLVLTVVKRDNRVTNATSCPPKASND